MTRHFKQLMEGKPMESFLIPQLYLCREGLKELVPVLDQGPVGRIIMSLSALFFFSFHSLKKKERKEKLQFY